MNNNNLSKLNVFKIFIFINVKLDTLQRAYYEVVRISYIFLEILTINSQKYLTYQITDYCIPTVNELKFQNTCTTFNILN